MKSAIEMLATIAAISPQRLKERAKHWASVRIALEGLGVRPDAISRCKQFILQVCHSWCRDVKTQMWCWSWVDGTGVMCLSEVIVGALAAGADLVQQKLRS